VDYLFASCHKGLRFKSPGGYLCETGILMLAMSHYRTHFANVFAFLNETADDCDSIFLCKGPLNLFNYREYYLGKDLSMQVKISP
jgi:hypothetical protein